MKRIVLVKIIKCEAFYVAECLDLPVVTQAVTLDDLMVNIHEAARRYFSINQL